MADNDPLPPLGARPSYDEVVEHIKAALLAQEVELADCHRHHGIGVAEHGLCHIYETLAATRGLASLEALNHRMAAEADDEQAPGR